MGAATSVSYSAVIGMPETCIRTATVFASTSAEICAVAVACDLVLADAESSLSVAE